MSKNQLIIVILFALATIIALIVATRALTPEPVIEEAIEVEVVEAVPEPSPTVVSSVIGQSVEGRDITVTTFGYENLPPETTQKRLLFVGGVHGGYEWNSSLLAYEMIDHLTANPQLVPQNVIIDIIPDLNPDGTFLATGVTGRFAATDVIDPSTRLAEGRFNANGIDLNRNFDCNWAPESSWRGNTVSAGTGPFSEPEAAALQTHVTNTQPDAAIFWHSVANTVYASECNEGVLPETLAMMNMYAKAGNYNTQATFDAYSITGDAEGWLASIGIPAITVELQTPDSIEWTRNFAGFEALVSEYAK